ncbi:MAG: magnesium chelatase, partial [Bacteroidales bacterium]|nr:magnesium chelatase [Bacteroidales bacterium]
PLLDRIDMHVEVTPVPFEKLSGEAVSETSSQIRERVSQARAIQSKRFESEEGLYCNAQMETRHLHRFCRVSPEASSLLKLAMNRLGLSARAYDRILKVSRTIADLDGAESILPAHISEAIRYRSLDRDRWGMP